MATTPVIITIPKYVTATGTISSGASIFKDYVEFKSLPDDGSSTVKSRKRRLDHLSWEEKLQRKKLKNRVAAQTSRDRKKQKMEEVEDALKQLMDKNEALMNECMELQTLNKQLSAENGELRKQIALAQCSACGQSTSVDCTLSNGPAESRSIHPRPQGTQRVQSAGALDQHQYNCRRRRRHQTTVLMLKLLLTSLLCQPTSSPTLTQNSTLTSLKSLLRAYSTISPQTWKQLLQKNRLHQVIAKKVAQDKWWGRHQSTWNPVGTTAC